MKQFNHVSLQDAQSIKAILKSLTNNLGKGKVILSDEKDELVLEPEGLLTLQVMASKDDDKSSLSLQIEWRSDREITKRAKLSISGS
ncbi:MAG: hypothetical protein CBB92_03565 [Flammeovirgaceae bacterium TMED32]|nr:amphi-Trp domain-containing protein [Rhodospirillaceae bacterium]OUU01254.1 MAG: hypothetical protein CBB92_03565 [Flammeovirgaceae bacterium TMED32]